MHSGRVHAVSQENKIAGSPTVCLCTPYAAPLSQVSAQLFISFALGDNKSVVEIDLTDDDDPSPSFSSFEPRSQFPQFGSFNASASILPLSVNQHSPSSFTSRTTPTSVVPTYPPFHALPLPVISAYPSLPSLPSFPTPPQNTIRKSYPRLVPRPVSSVPIETFLRPISIPSDLSFTSTSSPSQNVSKSELRQGNGLLRQLNSEHTLVANSVFKFNRNHVQQRFL